MTSPTDRQISLKSALEAIPAIFGTVSVSEGKDPFDYSFTSIASHKSLLDQYHRSLPKNNNLLAAIRSALEANPFGWWLLPQIVPHKLADGSVFFGELDEEGKMGGHGVKVTLDG